MLHIKPLSYEQAPDEIKQHYNDIQKVLEVDIIPVLFQYIANYHAYFSYIWEQIKTNITTGSFTSLYEEVIAFSDSAIKEIYQPSPAMTAFIVSMPAAEKESIKETAHKLEIINAKLLLITIGIREALKGVTLGLQQLTSTTQTVSYSSVIDELFQQIQGPVTVAEQSPASLMLAPLYGNQSMIVTRYPKFFSLIAEDMALLLKTVAYLQKRVIIEQQGIMSVEQFTSPLSCSYAELLDLVNGQAYFDELLYLLVDTFPTQFPRLLLTSALMRNVIEYKSTQVAVT